MNNKQLRNLLIREQWDEARNLIQKADNADRLISAPCALGDNALFIAIWVHAPDDLITFIIEASNSAVSAKNNDGEQPLHYVAYYGASYAVLVRLIRKYPAALDERNVRGATPRDYLSENMLDKRSEELMKKETANILKDLMKGAWGRSSREMAQSLVKLS